MIPLAPRPSGGARGIMTLLRRISFSKNDWSACNSRAEFLRYAFHARCCALGSAVILASVSGCAGGLVPRMAANPQLPNKLRLSKLSENLRPIRHVLARQAIHPSKEITLFSFE